MTKLFLIALFTVLSALTRAELVARFDRDGLMHVSNVSAWNCSVSLHRGNETIKTEHLTSSSLIVFLATFNWLNKTSPNIVNNVSWTGTSCLCWFLLFDQVGYTGASTGFWTTESTTGSYDLTTLNYLEDSDDVDDNLDNEDVYRQWNNAISSYRIYCF